MCTFKTDKIYLSWKKEKGGIRRIIASLYKASDTSFIFKYKPENEIKEALEEGFCNYPAFNELSKEYSDNVLDVFKRRLVDKSRRDFKDFLDYWHCEEFKDDDFALLGLTGAKLQTDTFEFIAPHEEVPAVFYTEVAHLNKANEKVLEILRKNEKIEISLQREANNNFDCKAVKVLANNLLLGYIKSIHCENISDALDKNIKVISEIVSKSVNGTIKYILLRISVASD